MQQPTVIVYGVFEVPRYMLHAREVESVWTSEQEAADRARVRSHQVNGRVIVVSWTMNRGGGWRLMAAFADGEPLTGSRTALDLTY